MFDLGEIVVTPLATKRVSGLGIDLMGILTKHASCEWPEITNTERKLNMDAIENNRNVYSRYKIGTNVFLVGTNLREGFTDIKMGDEEWL